MIMDKIIERRSIRQFTTQPVDRNIITQCIEAARLAPSAENAQPWRFLVLDNPGNIQAFGHAAFTGVYAQTRWAMKAPVILVICAKLDIVANRIGRFIQGTPYYLIDIGIAGEHFVLEAQTHGLGTCWIGWFDAKKARKHLNLPSGFKVVQLIVMGYPLKDAPNVQKRKSIDEILRFNRW